MPRLPAPGASFSTPGERQLRRAARRRGRLGFQLGKRLENRKVGWARNGRKTDHGVVPPQDVGASTCDTQGPGHGGGHHRNSNDKARSHSSKIVLSIGVENRARTGGQRPICRPKPRCTSVSGPIRAVQVLARERISRCLSNWFSTPRPVVDAPDRKATDARSRSSPCKRMGLDGKTKNNRYECRARQAAPVERTCKIMATTLLNLRVCGRNRSGSLAPGCARATKLYEIVGNWLPLCRHAYVWDSGDCLVPFARRGAAPAGESRGAQAVVPLIFPEPIRL